MASAACRALGGQWSPTRGCIAMGAAINTPSSASDSTISSSGASSSLPNEQRTGHAQILDADAIGSSPVGHACTGAIGECVTDGACMCCLGILVEECMHATEKQPRRMVKFAQMNMSHVEQSVTAFCEHITNRTTICIDLGADVNAVIVANALVLLRRCPSDTFVKLSAGAMKRNNRIARKHPNSPARAIGGLPPHLCTLSLFYASIGVALLMQSDGLEMSDVVMDMNAQDELALSPGVYVAFQSLVRALDYHIFVSYAETSAVLTQMECAHRH